MTPTPGWDLYRTLLAVLTEGSLSGAARVLGLTQPTVGRHVSSLEQAFGQPLFTRSQTGLRPTEAALELRAHAEAMRSTAAALERAASGRAGRVVGTVRVSASEVNGVEVLPPMLAIVGRAHPDLQVEVVPTNRVEDLLHREADVAVRTAPPGQGALVAQRVGDLELGLFARTDYLDARGRPTTPVDLVRHALVGFDVETPFLRAARQKLPVWKREAFAVRTDSDLAQLAMIRAGCGIGFCQVALARRDPRLTRVLARDVSFRLETWVTMHEDLRASPRCKVVFDALVKGMRAHVGGRAPGQRERRRTTPTD